MDRTYLLEPSRAQQTLQCDLLVIGSGVAGLTTALRAAEFCNVLIVTKAELQEGSTRYAQGGIAYAIGEGDSTDMHFADTIEAGVGYCDEEAVRLVVEQGPDCYREMVRLGAQFDGDDNEPNLHREGGHSQARVVHAGDHSGAEVERVLVENVRAQGSISVLEHSFVVDISTENGCCTGVMVLINGEYFLIEATATVLASGGAGQLFSVTTNPAVVTGDGIAAAYRAGARVGDLEFIQFHPTALYENNNPRFLISEAVRGEGAQLFDLEGDRFMLGKHELAELAPRDVVVRNMALRMIDTHADHLFLDLRQIPRDKMQREFPTIYDELHSRGYNLHEELIPIAFAAHYTIGGVITDLHGRTTLPHLYACGEVACTGMHGANRLASNSLLEGQVFGRRIVEHLKTWLKPESKKIDSLPKSGNPAQVPENISTARSKLAQLMVRYGGVFRAEKRLARLRRRFPDLRKHAGDRIDHPAWFEMQNMLQLARMIHDAGLNRVESRGTHQRQEFHDADPEWAGKHITFEAGNMVVINRRAGGIDWQE